MNRRTSIYLPQFTVGEEAFSAFGDEMRKYGTRVAVVYGEKAWNASKSYVLPALQAAGLTVTAEVLYGKDTTFENVERILAILSSQEIHMILAVGGGKCIDTGKVIGDRMGKAVFTVPSIASNCSPVTKISIMYHKDGSFREIVKLKSVPFHCFIDPRIILAAPTKFLWAGIGDAMAKNVESEWSAKSGEHLDFGSEFGITAGNMCFFPMVREGKQALEDAKAGKVSEALVNTILNVVVAPGVTSVSVQPDYNGGIAHALFYGLTKRKSIEKNHLHGEVVSYGTLVNLILDQNWDKFKKAYELNRSIGLPVCLADLELDRSDSLEDVLEATLANQELTHTPYPVTKEMIYHAIQELEDYKS